MIAFLNVCRAQVPSVRRGLQKALLARISQMSTLQSKARAEFLVYHPGA
jgi:hypothetical protein